ncbi:lysophospholipid acyltransferase family protein [Streptomyces sp. S.PNR 29]|uniref:lysophospholipid acyltransferase family protein n=1 Tax=Streptomyces sp. S.PNR 29 TaxID=2973805 RepID=UPI0025B1280C|nr:lysophospholipid acyltransferase family protein [Streptomyces sp. S.PNR 29]MDN0198732.1 1-acyl-sn-glycerol-3-phosphate acyltransferase [Streptomyces sp. S.PNR 29]
MSIWLPTAPCTPGACVEPAQAAVAVPRAVLRLTAIAVLLSAGIALSPLGGRIPAGLVRRWCRWIVRAAGVRVRVTGAAASTGGLLLVANHISWLDIPLLAAVRPARMLAKNEIRQWPVAGPLAAYGGALFIERDRLRALPDTVAHIARELRAGAAVAVFPEGSTWCGRAQGPFRRAVFQAALDAGVPVQPVRIRYRTADGAASTAPAFVGEDSLLASLWRVATARGITAEVDVRPVLPPGSHPDRRSLARAAERAALPGPHQHQVPTPRIRRRPVPGPQGHRLHASEEPTLSGHVARRRDAVHGGQEDSGVPLRQRVVGEFPA